MNTRLSSFRQFQGYVSAILFFSYATPDFSDLLVLSAAFIRPAQLPILLLGPTFESSVSL